MHKVISTAGARFEEALTALKRHERNPRTQQSRKLHRSTFKRTRRIKAMETMTSLDGANNETVPGKAKDNSQNRGHEITSKTIKAPAFSYVCLQLISGQAKPPELDVLSVRSYITAALTQFLGLTGSAISVDILKVDPKECWIRVPREDLSPIVAAMGGWIGGPEAEGGVSWRVKAAGNWLSVLAGQVGVEDVWND
ncbi:hypothetical protein BDZ45DRAFT_351848 [Acephala macrosclerotiorum]|nr:hypothetical protein BDZ45DRAFT_351848 [Acephala macrosclerotiorum]